MTESRSRALLVQLVLWIVLLAVGLSPAAGVLNAIYTPLIILMAIALLLWRPMGYIGFVFWAWMLTPLVRRLADFTSGYHEVSLVMVAPLAATLVGALGLIRPSRPLPPGILLPHLLILAVLAYGFLIGVKSAGMVAASFAVLNWAAPVLFGLFLLQSSGAAADKAKAMFDALTWGLLVIGVYGIYQFFYLPAWDAYWMRLSDLRSIGAPVPLGVRVFSTLNAPAILGFFAQVGLLIAIGRPGRLTKLPLVPGAVTFLLSLVRSAWGGLAVGLLATLWKASIERKGRYVTGLVFAALCIAPVLATTEIGKVVQNRSSTITDLSQDDSLAARIDIYHSFSASSASAVFGVGLGGTGDVSSRLGSNASTSVAVLDSGLLEVVADFGVLSVFMFAGLGALLLAIVRSNDTHWVTVTATAVALASVSQLALANPFFGPAAMCFYPFLALSLLLGLERQTMITRQPALAPLGNRSLQPSGIAE